MPCIKNNENNRTAYTLINNCFFPKYDIRDA